MTWSTIASFFASLLLVGSAIAADGVRATSSSDGLVTVRSSDAASERTWDAASVLARERAAERSTIERAVSALRRSIRAPIASLAAGERNILGGGSHLVQVSTAAAKERDAAEQGATDAGTVELWYRRSASAPRVWVVAPDDAAIGRCVASTPAFDQGAVSGAAWLLGCELLATSTPQVWTEVLEHRRELGRDAGPGELAGRSLDELTAFVTRVQGTAFSDEAIDAARARLWDGTTLRLFASLDADAFGSALFTFGATTDELGAALRTLDSRAFRAAFQKHWDATSSVFATIATTVPDGSVDLTRSAWERSSPEAQARALKMLEAVGGADDWARLVDVKMVVATTTTSQAGVQSAESTTVRKLDGALTRIDQSVGSGDTTVAFTTGVVGTRLWLQRDGSLLDLPSSQAERVLFGEQRALPRVLSELARRSGMGARIDGPNLALFDDSGDICVLELGPTSVPIALVQVPARVARRIEFSKWKDFGGCLYPTHQREDGDRVVEVTVVEFERLDSIDLRRFANPLGR